MNYNSVILTGVIAATAIWWIGAAIKHYPGPKVMTLYIHDDGEKMVADNGQAVREVNSGFTE
jgi:hypothetical protein